ncbi:MAG TPA: hypothetical protein PLQ54_01620 [Armatimonadota bacterium]|nr:hypothetical protein [Armatimonadota bacterium]
MGTGKPAGPVPRRTLIRTLCFLFALCTSPLLAQGPHLLRLEPPGMDVSAVLKTIADEKLPVGGIIIDVARSGQTLFPVPDSVFTTRVGFEDGTQLTRWIDQIHAQGLKAYAGLDAVRWWTAAYADPDPFLERPELAELDSDLSCNPANDAKYASPWHPAVRSSLVSLARELGSSYQALDGIIVCLRLSPSAYTGFSDAARRACIDALRIDPLDLAVFGVSEDWDPNLKAWMEWRPRALTDLMRELTSAYRDADGTGQDRVIAIGSGAYPAYSLRLQACCADDWLTWALDGLIDGVALDTVPGRERWHEELAVGLDVLERARLGIAPYIAIRGEHHGSVVPLTDAYGQVAGAGLGGRALLLDPVVASELESAIGLLRSRR